MFPFTSQIASEHMSSPIDASNAQLNAVAMQSINGNEQPISSADNHNSSNSTTRLGDLTLHCCNELFSWSTQDARQPNIDRKLIWTKEMVCFVGMCGQFPRSYLMHAVLVMMCSSSLKNQKLTLVAALMLFRNGSQAIANQ